MQTITTIGLDIAKFSFPGSWHRGGGQGDRPPAAEASLRLVVLREAATVPDWHRSLGIVACSEGGPSCRSFE
jgi:hypothetical protein